MSTNIVKYRNLPGKYPRPPVPWTPEELTSAAWYDAADLSTITDAGGGFVGQWDDKSGNNHHVIQNNGGLQPAFGTRTINGLNALEFDGFDDFLQSVTGMPSGDLMIFTAHQSDTIESGTLVSNAGTNEFLIWLRNDSVLFPGPQLFVTGADTNPTVFMGRVDIDGGAPGTHGWRLNGGPETTADANSIAAFQQSIAIGAYPVPFVEFDGLIGEVIIIDGLLSDADRQRVEGYLAHKWGTAALLPLGHPYKDNPPYL